MYEIFRLLITSLFLSAPLLLQTTLQVASFNAIELPNGGHVVFRPAPTHGVTLVRGSLDYTRINVANGGRLVVDKCSRKCPRGYRLEIEIAAPSLTGISLANGGIIQSRGRFPRQGELAVAVDHGGTIDVRSMVADRVTASVEQGGRILTVPRTSLFARVRQGGVITYWGNAQVRSSAEHVGVVSRGRSAELELPLSEVGLPLLSPLTKIGHER